MNKNLVILPARNRPDSAARCVEALQKHSVQSDICVAIDEDQSEMYPRIPGVIYEVGERVLMNPKLNRVAIKYAPQYETVFFLGDDHLVRTPQWDRHLASAIASKGYGLAFGNDLLKGINLATAVMMSTNIIRTIGYMTPPKLRHLYVDDFWMHLGKRLGSLHYFDQVIIEHLHPTAGKQAWDPQYRQVNSGEYFDADRTEFARYLSEDFESDLAKLSAALGSPSPARTAAK